MPSLNMSKQQKVVKDIIGFRIDDTKEYLFVQWQDGIKTWEYLEDISGFCSLSRFIEKLQKSVDDLYVTKTEDLNYEREKLLREAIKKSVKQKKIDKEYKSNSLDGQKGNKVSLCENNISKALVVESQFMRNSNQLQNKRTSNFSDLDQQIKRTNIPVSTHTQKFNKFEIKNQKRYYEITAPMPKKENVIFKKKTPIKNLNFNKMTLVYENNHIGHFSNIIDIETNEFFKLEFFNSQKCISNHLLNSVLFSYLQNPNVLKISVYRAHLYNSVSSLQNTLIEMKDYDYSLVDDTDPLYNFIFVTSCRLFKKIQFSFEFMILKISKKLFTNISHHDSLITEIITSDKINWGKDLLGFNSVIRNEILFDVDKFNIQLSRKYFIFSDNKDPVMEEFNAFLQQRYKAKLDNLLIDPDYIFINAKYVDFIQVLPNFLILKEKKTRFIVINPLVLNSKFETYEIYQGGGIVVPSLSLLEQILEIPFMSAIMAKLMRKGCNWLCKISVNVYEDFEKIVLLNKDKLKYNELCQIKQWLGTCIEEVYVEETNMFLKVLEKKYLRNYRMYYVLNTVKSEDNMITPESLLELMK